LGIATFGLSVLTEVSQQEKGAGKSLLAGIEKLVNQVLFVPDVPGQQICHKHVGERTFPVNHSHHGLLVNSRHGAIAHRRCGAHAKGLSCEATFSEEIALVQNANGGFLPTRRQDSKSYVARLYIKDRVGRIALNKDRLFLEKAAIVRPPLMVERNVLRSNFLRFLAAALDFMIASISRVPSVQKASFYDEGAMNATRRAKTTSCRESSRDKNHSTANVESQTVKRLSLLTHFPFPLPTLDTAPRPSRT
jgi:hypothetical protein